MICRALWSVLKVMQELLRRPNLRYTYRFLILPETIGSVAYLSHQRELIPKVIGGLFLEMLGIGQSARLAAIFCRQYRSGSMPEPGA